MKTYEQQNPQDVRHMLSEGLSIARRRRWVFILPAAIAAMASLLYTFTYPRVYSARTMFERRDGLVLANLIRSYRNSAYSFAVMQQSIYVDIKGYKSVERAVEELGLDKDLPRDANGELTEAGRRMKQTLINKVTAECEVYLQEKTEVHDIITMALPSTNPVFATELITKLRDNYIRNMQERIGKLLANAHEYFKKELDKQRAEVSRVEVEIIKFRSKFVGIDPANPEGAVNRLTALRMQQQDLTRRIEELRADIASNEATLGNISTATTQPNRSADRLKVVSVRVAPMPTKPNPAHASQEARIRQIEKQILDMRMTMTEAHPQVRRLLQKLAYFEEELSRTAPTIPAASAPEVATAGHEPAGGLTPDQRVRQHEIARAGAAIRGLKRDLGGTERKLASVEERVARYKAEKSAVLEQREEYLRRQNELATARTGLEAELERFTYMGQLVNAEKNKRGLSFTVLEETQVSTKPISPKMGRLITMSLGFGVAVGLACVVLLEMLDRTFRSIGQVGSALQLPVLQSIGEIVTSELRRRRMARQVVMHAVATVLIALVCATSGLVYLSLERPQDFERIKANPGLIAQRLVGGGP